MIIDVEMGFDAVVGQVKSALRSAEQGKGMNKSNAIVALGKLPVGRSAWSRGVAASAREMLDGLADGQEVTREALLNGARDVDEYSRSGCALVYNADIAERYCSPSKFKRSREGTRMPNGRENWLDLQTRALRQAVRLIMRLR